MASNVKPDMNPKLHPLPYAYDVAFAVRDDDVSFFTAPEAIEKIYRPVWEKEFKVSFATVPKHKGEHNLNVPPSFRLSHKYFPISDNVELVQFLKSQILEKSIEIMQHGFAHSESSKYVLKFDRESGNLSNASAGGNFNNARAGCIKLAQLSEFYGMHSKEVRQRVLEGKRILEQTFGVAPTVFVAPQELLTRPLWKALFENNLDYCGRIVGDVLTKAPFRHINFYALLREGIGTILKRNTSGVFDSCSITDIIAIPATYRHYWNGFIDGEISERSFDRFKSDFAEQLAMHGYFILLTHYWEYFYDWEEEITQKRQYEYLNKAVDYVDSISNTWKCTVGELIRWIKARNNVVVQRRNGNFKVVSPIDIKGLTLELRDSSKVVHCPRNALVKERGDDLVIILDLEAGVPITVSAK